MLSRQSRPSRVLALVVLASLLTVASVAIADDRPVQWQYSEPTFAVRVYEIFQRGPKLIMDERTNRPLAPHNVRNIKLGEVWPPEGEAPIKVFRSRDHLEYFGSYWREDGVNDYGKYEVEVWEVDEADEPGVAYVRVRIVEREDVYPAPKRRRPHPEHRDAREAKN